MAFKRETKINFFFLLLFLVGGVAVFLLLTLTKPGVPQDAVEEPVISVRTYLSPAINVQAGFKAYGTAFSTRSLKLKSQVGGLVEYLHPGFLEGGLLKEGELIFRIEPSDYELAVKRAKAVLNSRKAGLSQLQQEEINIDSSLGIARKNLKLAEMEMERYRGMLSQGTVSPQQTEDIQLKLQQHEISVQNLLNSQSIFPVSKKLQQSMIEQAEVDLQISLLNLQRTEVRAPFDCIVQEKNLEQGQFVTAAEVLGRILDYSGLEIAVQIPNHEINWFIDGQETFEKDVLIRPLGPQGPEIEGEIVRLSGEYSEKSRSLKTFIRLKKDRPENFRHGVFCEIIFSGKSLGLVHRVARLSIFRNQLQFVRGGVLQQTEVKIIREEGDFVYIEPVLEPDDQVVYIFSETLSKGQKLQPEIVEL